MTKIKFTREPEIFYELLKGRVNQYFREKGIARQANAVMKVKIAILLSGIIVFYTLMYLNKGNYTAILLWGALFGIFSFLTALNVAHDAAHGAISKNRFFNQCCLYTLNFIGVNSYIWKLKHLASHHNFPNVKGTDADIGESRIGRLVPNAPWKWFCRFQHLYIPFIYLFYSAHWVLFKDFIHFKTLKLPNKGKITHPLGEYLILVGGKIFALSTTVILPYALIDLSILQTISLFFTIHLGPGILVALYLVPAHLNADVAYPVPDKNGMLGTSWSVHQVITTVDYSTHNMFYNLLLGGFNHHVCHHLFPTVCHCHYPRITPIIEATALECNIRYRSTSFIRIFRLHIRHLKNMGSLPKTDSSSLPDSFLK